MIRKFLGVFGLCVGVLVGVFVIRSFFLRMSSENLSCPRCNIVILDIDTLRADDVNCFNEGVDLTPNLCRLARQGVSFSNAYSQSFWTLPSALSTFTSLYPSTNRVWDEEIDAIASDTGTLASYIRGNGYQTYYSGVDMNQVLTQGNGGLRGYTHTDLRLTGDPLWLEEYKTALDTNRPILYHGYALSLHMPYRLHPGEIPITGLLKPKGFPVYWQEYDIVLQNYLLSHVTDIFTSEAILKHPEIFESDPSIRGERVLDYFNLLESQKDYTNRKYSWNAYYSAYMQFINPHNPADVAYLRMMYQTKVHLLDTNLSGFVDYLLRPDVANHTIVVITSSHGEAFGEHGTFSHDEIPYNELLHVPLIIKYPSSVEKRVDSVVENIDIFPTLAELVTGKTPPGLQGISLLPILSGVATQVKSFAISMNSYLVYIIQNRKYAVIVHRDNNFKPELYYLLKDPTEQHDIAAANPKIVDQMVHLLISTRIQPRFWLPKSNIPVPTGTDRQKLIRSGYF